MGGTRAAAASGTAAPVLGWDQHAAPVAGIAEPLTAGDAAQLLAAGVEVQAVVAVGCRIPQQMARERNPSPIARCTLAVTLRMASAIAVMAYPRAMRANRPPVAFFGVALFVVRFLVVFLVAIVESPSFSGPAFCRPTTTAGLAGHSVTSTGRRNPAMFEELQWQRGLRHISDCQCDIP